MKSLMIKLATSFAAIAIPTICVAQQSNQPNPTPTLHGIMRLGDTYSAQIDSNWISVGDSLPSPSGAITIKQIALDHILITRNGADRIIKLGQPLTRQTNTQSSVPSTR